MSGLTGPAGVAELLRAGVLLPGSLAEVREDGRVLAARVHYALRELGVAPAAIHRRGPAIVEVDLPANWPEAWDLAEVLPRMLRWSVRVRQRGPQVVVRRLVRP